MKLHNNLYYQHRNERIALYVLPILIFTLIALKIIW